MCFIVEVRGDPIHGYEWGACHDAALSLGEEAIVDGEDHGEVGFELEVIEIFDRGWTVAAVFSLVTVAMVVGQSCLAYAGLRVLRAPWLERYAHTLAGLVMIVTAVAVLIFGF